ncbi:MAG: methylmalonyl-CoA mutase family protein [Nocardioides sp.]|nr:methylmalonyl-CoA mutase family protein [Nocardioides sp.]
MTEVEGGLDEPTEFEPAQGTLALAAPEDVHTRTDWERSSAAVLRKARRMRDDDPDDLVWQKLTRTTLDGIEVAPLGTPDLLDALATTGRPTRQGDWDIRSQLSVLDVRTAHDQALVDLEGGVTSLWLTLGGVDDLDTLLEGVLLDLAPVVLESRTDPLAAARAYLDHVGSTVPAPGTNLGVDGQAPDDVLLAAAALARGAGVLGVVVDATVVHDQGASDAQELAHALAVGTRVLRVLTADGTSVDAAADLVEFRFAVTDEQFAQIAKLRAARRLWARVLELSGASPQRWTRQRQHAVTSRAMMSAYDPQVNMVRTTVAAFAAGVGGADAVTVLPFDSPLGLPDVLGRRVARNTSALLISEAHLARVADPAGGSYAVEKLTDDLARVAWGLFGRIEDGEPLDEAIASTRARREEQVARRTRPITGLTEFPDLAQDLPRREPDPLAPQVRRYGASFEALRAEPAEAPVFLATLGPVAAHTARATFATNLFAAGGVAVDAAGATADVGELLAAHESAGRHAVVCLAGSDAAYAEWGAAAAEGLRAAGATHVVVAGGPTDFSDDSCATGIDALDFLTRTREKLT